VPHSNDPYWSKFAVTNGSSQAIGTRDIFCKPILFVGVSGLVVDWQSIFSSGVSESWPSPDVELGPGSTETDTCLAVLQMKEPPKCLDVIVYVDFVLVNQPDHKNRSVHRFVATAPGGAWEWDEQPDGPNLKYCAVYARRPS